MAGIFRINRGNFRIIGVSHAKNAHECAKRNWALLRLQVTANALENTAARCEHRARISTQLGAEKTAKQGKHQVIEIH